MTVVALALMGIFASLAQAEGTPNISASVSSASVLYGEGVHVTLDAVNPKTEPAQPYGYNLSFRVVLPKGVSYGGGAPVAPTAIEDEKTGETVLIFSNVADLSPSSHKELGFELEYDESIWHAGDGIPVRAQAFINTDPRFVPKFNATGEPEGPSSTSYTGFSSEVLGNEQLKAIKVTAEEPSPEGEILRGVHEDQTVYTLKVQNNGVNPTTGTKLDAYVPAGLEYLGCGAPGGVGTDHTHDAIGTNAGSPEEYPNSGPIKVETLTECQPPELVETEELDPDGTGPLPFGVYTHVRWAVGALTAGEIKTFRYRAAVPIRANAKEFTGGTKPSGASGEQAANLDNNTGPETFDEQLLQTYATASGIYQGTTPQPTADETTLDRTAEDWVVHKKTEPEGLNLEQDRDVKWALTFETSEYKYVKEGVVVDTLPNGLCPLGPVNYTHEPEADDLAECDNPTNLEPSAPYTSAVENEDGTFTLTWNANQFTQLHHTGINEKFTLTFYSHTRTHYQEHYKATTPILSHDKVTNGVTTEAEGFARCLSPEAKNCETSDPAKQIFHQIPDGTTIGDASGVTLEALGPTLEKFVAKSGSECENPSIEYVKAPTVPVYHPGDVVCWKLRITFPGTLDTDAQTIADYLPPGSKYVKGSDKPFGENNVEATLNEGDAANGLLTWTAKDATVPAGGQVFERVIATEVAPVGTVIDDDLKGNLLKFSSANTPGESEALRAEADYEITIPVIGLVKGVEKVVRGGATVNGPNGENTDHVQVEGGDEVTYRVDLENTGGQDAKGVEVWDVLPSDYTCAEVKEISNGGTCETTAPADHIVWVLPSLATNEHQKLNYTVTVPNDVGPGRTLVNTAGVAKFEGETNTGGSFTYTPAENIDPETTAEANAPAAKDPSNVFTAGAAVGKTETTSVTEGGNNAGNQATIGETITYKVTAEVPEGTTLGGNAELTDALNSAERQAYVPGSATATLNGSALPTGPGEFELNTSGSTPKVVFPTNYSNVAGSGVDKVVLEFQVLVTNVPANVRGASLTDQAKLAWTDPTLGPQSTSSSTLTTTVVEPLISQEKKDDKNPSRVKPGEIVTYTVSTADSAAANVSTAHEVEIKDLIPAGLTPVKGAGEALADGEEVPGSGGAFWHVGSRTITKSVATIVPGAKSSFSYLAEVDNPATGGAELTNTVESTTASLGSAFTGRRTSGSGYSATAADTVRISGAVIEKSQTPAQGTPGDPLTYHLKVTIPAAIKLFDTTVRDVLPTGVEFDGYGAETCLSGCPLANEIHQYKPSVDGTTGKETIAWDLGDIPALGEPQVIEFTYTGHIRATNRVVGGKVVKGNTEVNAATVSSDLTNKGGAFNENAIPTTFDETSTEAKTTTTVVEPHLTIDKKIKVGSGSFTDGPTVVHAGEPLAYQLIVKNEGNSPAYEAEVTDTPDVAVKNVQVVSQAGVTVTAPWNETTHAMTLQIAGPIPAGGSTTIEYTAEFVSSTKLHNEQHVKNTAAVPLYFGVPATERLAHPTWEFREYEEDPSDATEAIVDFPVLGLTKTTGLSGNPDAGKAEVGQEFPWRVLVSNSSATAGASAVHVADTLPPNWTYTAGSAEFNGAAAPDPTIVTHPTGDTLEWIVPALPASSSVAITYGAKPQLAAATNPGTAVEANVNTALVTSATDEWGGTGNEEGPYGTAPDTAKATLGMPALSIEKTPDGGAATAGEPSSFTIKVKNTGNATARNLDVKDVLPKGLGYTDGEASGAPAAIAGETVTSDAPGAGETTIHWHLTSLAEGATETITVPVSVAADVADGTTLTNSAAVTSDEVTTPAEDDGSLVVGAEADMSIEKTGAAGYTAGENYTWHLRVKNHGPSDAQAVEVKDPLPAGTTFVSVSSPCAASGGEVTCALGTAAPGFDQTYDVIVHVEPGVTTSPLSNTATVGSTTTDPDESNNHSTFGPTSGALADVWVKKTVAEGAILRNHQTTFTIEIGNDGPSTARNVKVVDPLPAGLEFISTDEPPCAQAAGTVTCEFGDMAPGETATVHIRVKGIAVGVDDNVATVSTTTPEEPGGEPDTSEAEVSVGPVADLAIVKTAPATVDAGGKLTWTLEITNNGPDPATGVTVVDPLPAGVQFVSADPGCADAAGTVTCAVGALAVGESTTRQVTVTVPYALADSTVVNSASVHGEQGDDEPANDHSEAKTKVGPSADLAIVKSGPASVDADAEITWTLIITNHGPSTATDVKVEDTLPGGVTLVSASPSQGNCGGTLVCSLGTIGPNGSAQIQVVGHVAASLRGSTIVNTAKVSGDQPDPVTENNSSSATTKVEDPGPSDFNLVMVKTLEGPAKPELGNVLTYGLTVTNEGPATAKSVKATDTLPAALEYVSATIPGGSCSAAGPVVTCKLGSLAGGAKAKAMVKARAVAPGTVKNTASVSAAHADARQVDNHDVAAARVQTDPTTLRLVKQRLGHGPVRAGKTVKFRIRVSNVGHGTAMEVLVCDQLPAAMSYVSVKGAKFRDGAACWSLAALKPGASHTYIVVARIAAGVGGGTVRNVATVEAGNAPGRKAVATVRVKAARARREGGVTG